jgi:hypothetical protein
MAIHAVETSVQLSAQKPRRVSLDERAALDGVEITLPCEKFASEVSPKSIRFCHRELVHLLVLLQA